MSFKAIHFFDIEIIEYVFQNLRNIDAVTDLPTLKRRKSQSLWPVIMFSTFLSM